MYIVHPETPPDCQPDILMKIAQSDLHFPTVVVPIVMSDLRVQRVELLLPLLLTHDDDDDAVWWWWWYYA